MIEFLHNAIRATAGTPIGITALITDDADEPIEAGCSLWLHNDNDMIAEAEPIYLGDGVWTFQLTPQQTEGLCGRFWYCIRHTNDMLCFKEPIYLI